MSLLCELLSQPRDFDSEVARYWDYGTQGEHSISWGQFLRDVSGLRRRLVREPDGPWVLLTEDAYAFAVGLLALWHSGRFAILPPNRQPEALRSLQTRAGGVLCDTPDWLPEGACLHPLLDATPGVDSEEMTPLSPKNSAVELYTSGTTGGEKPVMKRIGHLEKEVAELESLWGERVAGSVFFATALHQHLYGLLFGVLWPLGAGHSFQTRHILHAGEAVPQMLASGRCVLASVPTHLKLLARHGGTADLDGVCREVFSSGGPLPENTAHGIARILGRPPVEVLGSTETGGIGWRMQEPSGSSSLWTPFPSVQVTCVPGTRAMRVRSPFTSVDSGEAGFATGDQISWRSDGRFALEGRIDRVVKVGEKRVDLSGMESQLRGHPLVEDLALMVIERDGTARVAAAVVPSDDGWALVSREQRSAFGRQLRSKLAEAWDPVLHPRYWRFVRQLPENPQGKLTKDALNRLFLQPGSQEASSDQPVVLEEFRGLGVLERSCQVPMDLSCFPDHALDDQMVPGVLLLDWALRMMGTLLGETPWIDAVDSMKFLAPLRGGELFRIKVRISSPNTFHMTVSAEKGDIAKGRIQFRVRESGAEDVH